MSANTVIQKIEEKAETQCEQLRADAAKKAEQLRADAEKACQMRVEQLQAQTDARIQLLHRAVAQQAVSENKIAVLNHKYRLLGETRAAAKASILALPDTKRRALLEGWIRSALSDAPTELHFSEHDAQLFVASKTEFGKHVVFGSIAKSIDGGVILSTAQYDMDLSFDAVLDAIFDAHKSEFAALLFEKNEGSV